MQPDGQLMPWQSPDGVPIRLAAAVPQFSWTDLAQALIDNGRASDDSPGAPPPGPHESPYGVEKQSCTDALFADGTATAQYAGPGDPTADLPGWFAAISAGEPTTEGDLGHAYTANPHALWVSVNDEANAFLSAVLGGQRPPLPRFTITTVGCLPGQPVTTYHAASFAALATRSLQLTAPGPATVASTPSPVPGAEAIETDPVANGGLPGTSSGCRVMNATTDSRGRGLDLDPRHPAHPGRRASRPRHRRLERHRR